MLDDIDKLLGDDEPTGGGGAGPDAPLVVVIDDVEVERGEEERVARPRHGRRRGTA